MRPRRSNARCLCPIRISGIPGRFSGTSTCSAPSPINLTLDVAYVGVHGYNETHSVDLNEPALGTGWNPNSATQTIFAPAAGGA